jgi:hypothetical protein
LASVTCPLCTSEVEAELLAYGPLRILERCPTCAGGPVAVNLADAVAPFADVVTIQLRSTNAVELAKAIRAFHPDFANKSLAEALKFARECGDAGVTFDVPQMLSDLLRARLAADYPHVQMQ